MSTTEPVQVPESSKSADSTEPTEKTGTAESAETAERTETAESAETAESTRTAESTESTESTERAAGPDGAEVVEAPKRPNVFARFIARRNYDYVGLVFALTFFCLSVTPSLLPRGSVLQGIISGILTATGYGLGVLLLWAVRRLLGRPKPLLRPNRIAWIVLGVLSAILIVVFLWLGSGWQQEIHKLMGMDPPNRAGYILVLLIGVVLAVAFVGLGRVLRRTARWLTRLLGRFIPAPAARLIGTVAVVLLVIYTLNGVIIDNLLAFMDASFKQVNSETEPGFAPPNQGTRSGGPGSLVSWSSLGNQGRKFVAGGPTTSQLREFSGTDPVDPIRVYAGLDSASSTAARADVAARELVRTGALDRKVLVVITTTGTGWVDADAVDPLEYMYNGDTAMVGMQYSYLPSWLSFLVDRQRAHDAGRELFDAVYRVWSARPAGQRPKLLVFGESLGSFGAETAFSGSADMRNRTDGMLLLGPPNSNTLWTQFVEARESGTPEISPIYQDGATVRFAADPDDLLAQPGAWDTPRVVYLQHPSDPIVWWSPNLMLSRPDWLEEERGDDVLPSTRWYPFVTFWQVTADMAFSTGVPGGHGHNYGTQPVKAWAVIAAPAGWTDARTEALEQTMSKGD